MMAEARLSKAKTSVANYWDNYLIETLVPQWIYFVSSFDRDYKMPDGYKYQFAYFVPTSGSWP